MEKIGPRLLRLTPLDVLLGYQKIIEATFFYPDRIDAFALKASLMKLTRRIPALSGRIVRNASRHPSPLHGWSVIGDATADSSVMLDVVQKEGTSIEAAMVPDPSVLQGRGVRDPAVVMSGRSPVMAASLANFASGGSALSIRMSHAIVDANGFYRIILQWSRLHHTPHGGDKLPATMDNLQRDCVQDVIDSRLNASKDPLRVEQSESHKSRMALDMRTWSGSALFWLLRSISTAGAPVDRPFVSFSAREVDELRAHCHHAGAARRPSANEALTASLWRVATKALDVPSARGCQLQMVFDVRGAVRLPSGYLGNAFHVLGASHAATPPHLMPLADVCANVHELALKPFEGNSLEDGASLSGCWLQHAAMLEQGCLPAPSGDDHAHRMIANFQAHLPAFEINFGAGDCMRVVPGPGDSMQMVPGPNKGIDVYLNLGVQPADWQDETRSKHVAKRAHMADWWPLRDLVLNPST